MVSKVELEWIDGVNFQAKDEEGTVVQVGGKGADPAAMRPMHMVLSALAGCAAIGIRNILEKKRQQFTELKFEVEGDRQPEPPTTFIRIRMRVVVRGHNLDRKQVEHAVQLTEEKHCSVYALLRPAVPIHTSLAVEEAGEAA